MVRLITTVLTLAIVLVAVGLAWAWYDGSKAMDRGTESGWFTPAPDEAELSLFETTVAKAIFGATWDETGFPCRTVGRLWSHYTGQPDRRGMSISQVVARDISYLDEPSQSLRSQVRQLSLACLLEGKHNDTELLRLWLRRVHFGNGMYGPDAAAQAVFGKAPGTLDKLESEKLTALLYWPGTQDQPADWERRTAIIASRAAAAD
jgi:hypothetical protein